jgi:hypothetical protein
MTMAEPRIKVVGTYSVLNAKTREVLLRVQNIVTDAGLELLADRMSGNAVNAPSHLAIGTSSAPAVASDTVLGAEQTRIAFSTTSSSANTYSAEATIPSASALFVWKELGVMNAATGGVLFSRVNVDYDHPTFGIDVTVVYEATFTRT